jgi:hypothetical protein
VSHRLERKKMMRSNSRRTLLLTGTMRLATVSSARRGIDFTGDRNGAASCGVAGGGKEENLRV